MSNIKNKIGCIESIKVEDGSVSTVLRFNAFDLFLSDEDVQRLVDFHNSTRDPSRQTHLTCEHCVCAALCDCHHGGEPPTRAPAKKGVKS